MKAIIYLDSNLKDLVLKVILAIDWKDLKVTLTVDLKDLVKVNLIDLVIVLDVVAKANLEVTNIDWTIRINVKVRPIVIIKIRPLLQIYVCLEGDVDDVGMFILNSYYCPITSLLRRKRLQTEKKEKRGTLDSNLTNTEENWKTKTETRKIRIKRNRKNKTKIITVWRRIVTEDWIQTRLKRKTVTTDIIRRHMKGLERIRQVIV